MTLKRLLILTARNEGHTFDIAAATTTSTGKRTLRSGLEMANASANSGGKCAPLARIAP
jgi:hypothetical protein